MIEDILCYAAIIVISLWISLYVIYDVNIFDKKAMDARVEAFHKS